MTNILKPFVRWAGGKTQLLRQYTELLPARFEDYYEPFLGGGAMLFHLLGRDGGSGFNRRYFASDLNPSLIDAYRAVQLSPRKLRRALKAYEHMTEAHFNETRARFNVALGGAGTVALPVGSAAWFAQVARFIGLNKSCFNGLYRVNSAGGFNVPWNKNSFPHLPSVDELVRASRALENVVIAHARFSVGTASATALDLVYMDPPYVPVSETACFTDYTPGGFDELSQSAVAYEFRRLDSIGAFVMASNHNTPEIVALYESLSTKTLDIQVLKARRSINSSGGDRGPVEEVLIRNFV